MQVQQHDRSVRKREEDEKAVTHKQGLDQQRAVKPRAGESTRIKTERRERPLRRLIA
jgi:hypothetical protein